MGHLLVQVYAVITITIAVTAIVFCCGGIQATTQIFQRKILKPIGFIEICPEESCPTPKGGSCGGPPSPGITASLRGESLHPGPGELRSKPQRNDFASQKFQRSYDPCSE